MTSLVNIWARLWQPPSNGSYTADMSHVYCMLIIVLEILEEWHLADRWWVSPAEADATSKGHADRIYFRIRCQQSGTPWDMLCEIYFDQAHNVWVMDRVLD